MKLTIAIIDDELHAIETLVYDLNEGFEDTIEILFTATNPVEGLKQIKTKKPDLVFLDIQMPGLSGIDILSLIDALDIMVVITTAHAEFALQTVGTKAIAYLLKPVQPENLENIIEQALKKRISQKSVAQLSARIAVPVFDGIELINQNKILYCKSDGNYSEIVLDGQKKIVASKTLKYLSELLLLENFVRVHNSYLVNIQRITKYLKRDGGVILMENDDIIPLSRNKRDEILKLIQNIH